MTGDQVCYHPCDTDCADACHAGHEVALRRNAHWGMFRVGSFTLHGGAQSYWKIDCDSLHDEDIEALAVVISRRSLPFSHVEGVPRGGLRLAAALDRHTQPEIPTPRLLIVDDVLTTGSSMEFHRAGRGAIGAVLFARGQVPPWVTALFTLNGA